MLTKLAFAFLKEPWVLKTYYLTQTNTYKDIFPAKVVLFVIF